MIRLTTLGALDLRDRLGHPLRDVLAQPKRMALLAYLVLEGRQSPLSRDRLLAMFWPESDDARARNALSQSLHHLRQSLGPDLIESQGANLLLVHGEALWCDAVVFGEATERGEPELALDVYRGDFCPTLFVSGAPEAEAWLETQRRKLRGQALAAARALAERLAAKGDGEGAGRVARRALAMRPDDEADVRAMLGLLERVGDAAGALSAYQDFAKRISEDLELEPARETKQLVENIRKSREQAATTLSADAPATDSMPRAAQSPAHTAGRRPRPMWSARRVAIVGAVLTAGALTWWRWEATHKPPPPDPQFVVVAPWSIASADTSLGYLVEGLSDLVAAKLSIPGKTRTADLSTVVAAWRRAGGGRPLSERDAMRESLRLGAGWLVSGSLVGSARNLIITARVITTDGQRRDVVTVTGPVDSLGALADSLARGLLLATFAEAAQRADELGQVPLAALRPYLLARSAFRGGLYARATEYFSEAVAADSNFALAALGAIEAADFLAGGSDLASYTRALRLKARLPAADRTLLAAMPDLVHATSRAARLDILDRFTRLAPERPEGWYWFGDALFHDGTFLGRDSGFVRAEAAFARAVALDSGFLAPLAHLVQIAAAREDRREVRHLADLYFARDTASDVAGFLRWRVAMALGDEASARRIEADAEQLPTGTVQLISEWSVIEGLSGRTGVRMAEVLYRRASSTGADLVYAERVFVSAAEAAGQFARAELVEMANLSRSRSSVSPSWFRVAAGLWLDGPTATLDSLVTGEKTSWTAGERVQTLGVHIVWALRSGQPDSTIARLSDAWSSTPRRPDEWPITMLLVAALHQPDLPQHLARVESERLAAHQAGNSMVMLEATAFLLNHDPARAALAASHRAFATGGDGLIAPRFRLEGLARERAGDTAGAIRAYRSYLNLRSDPDPDARAWADTVRAALARLEHGSRRS